LGQVKQEYSVVILLKKYAVIYIMSYMSDTDGIELRDIRDKTNF
jgi:hypothetical protein